jgi:hypothetical protein
MASEEDKPLADMISRFDGRSFSGMERFTYIGNGLLGAKARGLAGIKTAIESKIAPRFLPAIETEIPPLTVIATGYFDLFIEQNKLIDVVSSAASDAQITRAFQEAELPVSLVNDLAALIARVRVPLAIRSSSLLEDAMHEPFAGVYATRMLPNNLPDEEDRLETLLVAVKHIYASTFFAKAQNYLRLTNHSSGDEKMAVIIQQAVGIDCHSRFYPQISGVARSFNFYPTGLARPEDGVVELALGLGKIIVDEGVAWSFSPAYPHTNPPYNTLNELLKQTQKDFWAIDMTALGGRWNGDREYVDKYSLADAEKDGSLTFTASTFKAEDATVVRGISETGPRILDFAQILKGNLVPLAAVIKDLLGVCEESLGTMVEIEFAVAFPHPGPCPARFGFLQVRPMIVSHAQVEVTADEFDRGDILVASESALGNGSIDSIRDIVYVRPDTFETTSTQAIARELEGINRMLTTAACPYVLIGFGRWGSSDPSTGIPVNFGQISGARAIIEATLPNMNYILSQGAHFFHNLTSFKVLYFSVGHTGRFTVDWDWLGRQPVVSETRFIRHVRLASPLHIKVDGRTSRGVIVRS